VIYENPNKDIFYPKIDKHTTFKSLQLNMW
jgi:hypothetical protein